MRQAESNPAFKLTNQQFADQASLQQAQSKLDAAQSTLNNANADLQAIREQATRLLQQHNELAEGVEDALRRASNEAPVKPGLLERLGDALDQLGQGISDAAGKAWQWVEDHADDLKQVGDVLSTVGSVLGVVALATSWIPGVNAVTAAGAGVGSVKKVAIAEGADYASGKVESQIQQKTG